MSGRTQRDGDLEQLMNGTDEGWANVAGDGARSACAGRTYESHFGYCSRLHCYILNSVNAAAYKSSRHPIILTGNCDERIV
jgi:hypothetical protein